MRASDLMTKGVQTVKATTTADDAWSMMRLKNIHHLVVVEGAARVGVLSDRDVGSRGGGALRRGRTVADLMSPHVVTVESSAPVRRVANLMRGRSIGSVVVTDGDRTVGIITIADLLELLGRGLEHPASNTSRTTLHHRGPHRKRNQSTGVW